MKLIGVIGYGVLLLLVSIATVATAFYTLYCFDVAAPQRYYMPALVVLWLWALSRAADLFFWAQDEYERSEDHPADGYEGGEDRRRAGDQAQPGDVPPHDGGFA